MVPNGAWRLDRYLHSTFPRADIYLSKKDNVFINMVLQSFVIEFI